MDRSPQIPSQLAWLGALAVAPLTIFVIGPMLGLIVRPFALYALTSYAGCLLGFMGAIHWGMAIMRRKGWDSAVAGLLALLCGWSALIVQPSYGLLIVMAGFVALFLYDRWASFDGRVPSWYAVWRMALTIAIIAPLAWTWWQLP
jgi:Protein of unknown function (DUF3429)